MPSKFFFQPGSLIHLSNYHLEWIRSPFMFSLPISKVLMEPAIAWRLYAGYPLLLHEAKNVNGVLVFADFFFLLESIWYNVELGVYF